MNLNYSK